MLLQVPSTSFLMGVPSQALYQASVVDGDVLEVDPLWAVHDYRLTVRRLRSSALTVGEFKVEARPIPLTTGSTGGVGSSWASPPGLSWIPRNDAHALVRTESLYQKGMLVNDYHLAGLPWASEPGQGRDVGYFGAYRRRSRVRAANQEMRAAAPMGGGAVICIQIRPGLYPIIVSAPAMGSDVRAGDPEYQPVVSGDVSPRSA